MSATFVTGVSKFYFSTIWLYPTVCKYPVMKLADRLRIRGEYIKWATHDDKRKSLWQCRANLGNRSPCGWFATNDFLPTTQGRQQGIFMGA